MLAISTQTNQNNSTDCIPNTCVTEEDITLERMLKKAEYAFEQKLANPKESSSNQNIQQFKWTQVVTLFEKWKNEPPKKKNTLTMLFKAVYYTSHQQKLDFLKKYNEPTIADFNVLQENLTVTSQKRSLNSPEKEHPTKKFKEYSYSLLSQKREEFNTVKEQLKKIENDLTELEEHEKKEINNIRENIFSKYLKEIKSGNIKPFANISYQMFENNLSDSNEENTSVKEFLSNFNKLNSDQIKILLDIFNEKEKINTITQLQQNISDITENQTINESNIFITCSKIGYTDFQCFANLVKQGYASEDIAQVYSFVQDKDLNTTKDILKAVSTYENKKDILNFIKNYIANIAKPEEILNNISKLKNDFEYFKNATFQEKKIYIDYLIKNGLKSNINVIKKFIFETKNQYPYLKLLGVQSVFEKHFALTANEAKQTAIARLAENTNIKTASVLVSKDKKNLLKAISIALRANNVKVSDFLKHSNSGDKETLKITHSFFEDDPFTKKASGCKVISFSKEPINNYLTNSSKSWSGVELVIVNQSEKPMVIHCVPI